MTPHPVKWSIRAATTALLLLGVAGWVRPALAQTIAVRWNDVLMECVRRSKIGPPMVARAIGVTHTCGFDAWAMYDDVAVGTRLGGALRRPPGERTPANKQKAYSYAEYRALLDLFPAQTGFIRDQMTSFGYDPDDASTDPATAAGIGNVCANAVTSFRHHDASNQLGDLHTGAYTDYTGYVPVNSADRINDPNRWQPLRFCDGHGGFVSPGYIAPFWGNVIPFALSSSSEFRPAGPQLYPHGGYVAQAEEVLHLNAHIDDREKMIAEYWADGPRSELPPGHWTLFGEFVSNRDHHTLDQDAKMFFEIGNAVLDAGIAVWEGKRYFDSERPITAIHFLKAGKKVLAYVPFQGKKVINGEDWMPYQPCSFVTPPFPEYPSGHSAFSSAGAEILKRFTGSDAFGGSVSFAAGSGRVEPGFAPAHDVTLSWATFSDAADEAGMSRRWGGIHFEEGDVDSRVLGRQVGAAVWDKAQTYINGTATPPASTFAAEPRTTDALAARPSAPASEAAFALTLLTPNPTSGGARFEFTLPRAADVRITVLDVQGREIATLARGEFAPGRHEASWDGSSSRGPVGAGVYFVRYHAPAVDLMRRVVVMR